MAPINVTISVPTMDDIIPVEVDTDDLVSKLQGMVEMVCNIPADQQQLAISGRPLDPKSTLGACGVVDNDVVIVLPKQNQAQANMQDAFKMGHDGAALNPQAMIDVCLSNAGAMQALRSVSPHAAEAAQKNSIDELQAALKQVHLAKSLPEDPLDPEYQRRMMEHINQQNIDSNFENAMEHSPEVFARVEMLYVDMSANGEPLKVFVDSGAQMTIMTQACAEKCNILRLVDKRFAGLAVGVGSNKIIGKIHACPLKVGDQFISTSITVLEQKGGPQCIFGLDNMKRHHCVIDLKKNSLLIGTCGVELPFLPEHQVPDSFNVERQLSDAERLEADQASKPDAVAGSTSTPATATAEAPAAQASKPEGSAIQQLMDITNATAAQCKQALDACGGNVDMAAGMLMGL